MGIRAEESLWFQYLDDFLRATAVLAEYLREQSAFAPRASNS
jgi:hypothetical protein